MLTWVLLLTCSRRPTHLPRPRPDTHTQPGAPAWVSSRSRKVRRGFCPETAQGGSLGAPQRPRPLPGRCSGEKAQCDRSSLPVLGLCPSLTSSSSFLILSFSSPFHLFLPTLPTEQVLCFLFLFYKGGPVET